MGMGQNMVFPQTVQQLVTHPHMVPVAQSRPCCAKAQIPGLEQTCDARPISKKVEDWCHLAGVKMMHLHGKKMQPQGQF